MSDLNDKQQDQKQHDQKEVISHPHDGIFKYFMQDVNVTRDFLNQYLPDNIKQICDLSTLQMRSTNFIDQELKTRNADILYSVQTEQGDGYIYCAIEAQVNPDETIAWRLFQYCVMVMSQHLKQGHDKLPLVYPILFSCGDKPYPEHIPLNWLDLCYDPELTRTVFNQPIKVVDVQTEPDEVMFNNPMPGLMMYVFKHVHVKSIDEMIEPLKQFLAHIGFTVDEVKSILNYIFNQGKIEQPEYVFNQLHHNISVEQHKEVFMTMAEYLQQKGREQGEQSGLQQGLAKGAYQTAIDIAKNMLAKGADIEFIQSTTNLSEEEIKKLIH